MLYLASTPGASGTYSLSGGFLSMSSEFVGSGTAARASFRQNGGVNTGFVAIAPGGTYQLGGGTIQVTGGFVNTGTFDGQKCASLFSATAPGGCLVSFGPGNLVNCGSMSVVVGAGSLVILPSGFNTATGFASYSNAGLTHVAGTTLVISPSQGFSGGGTIYDLVDCQGTISAPLGYALNLNNGVTISGTGTVSLGSGTLTINNSLSIISGGQLFAGEQYIGNSGNGTFRQSGGTVSEIELLLGNNPADMGTYQLSSGPLGLSAYLYVGYSGSGNFVQSGGTLSCHYDVNLGYNAGSSSAYTLSGTGIMSSSRVIVGYSGSGNFTQSGGTQNFDTDIIGYLPGSSGVYGLNGGVMHGSTLEVGGSGAGSLSQSGGSCSLHTSLLAGVGPTGSGTYTLGGGSLSADMEIIGSRGVAIFSQSGGCNTVVKEDGVTGTFFLGQNPGSTGTYALSGGTLSAPFEYVGYQSGASGLFQQTGGLNSATTILIGSGQRYASAAARSRSARAWRMAGVSTAATRLPL